MKVWGYAQHELIYIVWALMDVALLTPFVLSVMGWARYWPPSTVLLLTLFLMLFAFNLTRLMSALNLPPERQQLITAVTLLVTIIIFLRSMFHAPTSIIDFNWLQEFFDSMNDRGNILWVQDVVLLFIIILSWGRGIQLSLREYTVDRVGLRLRVGGLILAPLVIWFANIRLLYSIAPFIFLFFLAGLTAVSLIRAEELEQDKSGHSVTLSPRWFGAVLITAMLIISIGVVLTTIISGETAEQVSSFFAPAVNALRILATVAFATIVYLLLPFFYLLEIGVNWLAAFFKWALGILNIFAKIVSKLQRFNRAEVPLEEEFVDPVNQSFNNILEEVTGVGVDISRNWQIIIVLIIIAVILLVALMIGRIYRNSKVEERQFNWVDDMGQEDAEDDGFAKRLLRRLGFLQDWRTALSIRRIYRKMIRAAAGSGYPRMEAETPYEYLKTLQKVWPDYQTEAALITQAYVRVRYGEIPESKEELEAIRDAWKVLERTKPADGSSRSSTIRPTLNSRDK